MNKKPVGENVLYPDLSYMLIQIAFEIHNELGPGFTEDIYENAFICELGFQYIPYEQQKPIFITYKGQRVGNYRLDLVIDGKIILELKAVTALTELFKQHVLSYLKETDLRLGILINFGALRVEHHRVIN
jgi:GxxExxY protein